LERVLIVLSLRLDDSNLSDRQPGRDVLEKDGPLWRKTKDRSDDVQECHRKSRIRPLLLKPSKPRSQHNLKSWSLHSRQKARARESLCCGTDGGCKEDRCKREDWGRMRVSAWPGRS